MKPIIAANWKMNLLKNEALDLVLQINGMEKLKTSIDLIMCPAHCYLDMVQSNLSWGATGVQNISSFSTGAYTGEHGAPMVKSCGADYAIIGHSERRSLFGETNHAIQDKLNQCGLASIIPILCVGETLRDRQSGNWQDVIRAQLDVCQGLSGPLIVAYEPVWAIGTGETASPELANNAHSFIRNILGNHVPLLYGGSVNETNCSELLDRPCIDGALIGGASLKFESLSAILTMSALESRR